jgi:membrane peptidoglycan carboxypeptidase
VTYATAHSINTAFASMAYKLDEDEGTIGRLNAVKQIAEDAGISKTRLEKDVDEHKYLFSIGTAPVTPVEQAAGYSIFANEGKHIDYHVVKEVRQGKLVTFREQKDERRVISPEASADSVAAMEQVIKSGTARQWGPIGRPAAGKTGTNTNEKEAWFIGFTPQISTAVGMYREQCVTKSGKIVQPQYSNCPETPGGKPSKKYGPNNPYSTPHEVSLGFQGADAPTHIWHEFMVAALQGKPVEQFPQKAGMGSPENIVPSPAPSPSPTPTDDFPSDFAPDFPPDGGIPDIGCEPGDLSCDNGGSGGDDNRGEIQLSPNSGTGPGPGNGGGNGGGGGRGNLGLAQPTSRGTASRSGA